MKKLFLIIFVSVFSLFAVTLLTFGVLGKKERVGFIEFLDNRSIENTVLDYRIRIRYYNKVFRNSDIYGVYPKNDNLPNYVASIKWDSDGSPFGILTAKEKITNFENIENIVYSLKIKPAMCLYLILFAMLYPVVILITLFIKNIFLRLLTKNTVLVEIRDLNKKDYIFICTVIGVAVILFVFQFWLGFPGFFQNSDNSSIMEEALSKISSHWHPVFISVILSFLYKIFGYHSFYLFLINLICWYTGLALIINALYLKFYKKLVVFLFLLTCIANIFFQNFTQLKDITFTMYIWLVCSLIFFLILVPIKKKWLRIALQILTGVVLLFALLWRHNAIVTIYPLFVFFTYLLLYQKKIKSIKQYLLFFTAIMFCVAMSLVVIVKVHPLIWISKSELASSSYGASQHIFLHQIAACVTQSSDKAMIPFEWYEHGKTFEDLKISYQNNPLCGDEFGTSWAKDRVFTLNYKPDLKLVWIKAIVKHPINFFKHEMHFLNTIWRKYPEWILGIDILQEQTEAEWGISINEVFPKNERKITLNIVREKIYVFLLHVFPRFNHIIWISSSIILFFLCGSLWVFKKHVRSHILLFTFSTALSAFATACIVGFFSPVTDTRYMAPVLAIAIISLISFCVFIAEQGLLIKIYNRIITR